MAPRDYVCLARPSVRTLTTFATGRALEPLVAALAEKRLEVVISERYPLEQAEHAQQHSRAGNVVGKLVLVVNAPR